MLYAARQEFVRALEVVAQALDMHEDRPFHSLALVNGLKALDEAADFHARRRDIDRDLRSVAASHRTPVLQKSTAPVSPLAAAQLYYAHAQEQLALAVRPVPAGSAALCALGKLHSELARESSSFVSNAASQVKVFHQAALLVDNNNWEAANELAVLLVGSGNLAEARGWLLHSVSVAPKAESWHNLARVHEMFGETQLAGAAQAEALRLAHRGPDGLPAPINSPVDVQWVAPEEFAQRSTTLPAEQGTKQTNAPQGSTPAAGVQQAQQPAEPGGWRWPWKR